VYKRRGPMFHAVHITGECQNADGEAKTDGMPLYNGRPISIVNVIFSRWKQLDIEDVFTRFSLALLTTKRD